MSTAKKGFDPLSSLFDVPTPSRVPAAAHEEPTDPTAADEPISAPPVVIDREDEPAPVAPAAVAKAPAAPAVDPVQLARMLAKAAAAKAGAPKAMAAPAPAAAAPKPAAKAAPKAEPAASSRAFAAPPPKRALSAEEALAAARAQESAPKPAAAPAPARPAPRPVSDPGAADVVPQDATVAAAQAALTKALPSLADARVVRAVVMDDRGTLMALWKGHRARMGATGDLVAAVGVGAVLHALGNVGIGKLVAANVSLRGQELLVFLDLATGQAIAAFPDPRSWLGGRS